MNNKNSLGMTQQQMDRLYNNHATIAGKKLANKHICYITYRDYCSICGRKVVDVETKLSKENSNDQTR